MRPKIKISLVK